MEDKGARLGGEAQELVAQALEEPGVAAVVALYEAVEKAYLGFSAPLMPTEITLASTTPD